METRYLGRFQASPDALRVLDPWGAARVLYSSNPTPRWSTSGPAFSSLHGSLSLPTATALAPAQTAPIAGSVIREKHEMQVGQAQRRDWIVVDLRVEGSRPIVKRPEG